MHKHWLLVALLLLKHLLSTLLFIFLYNPTVFIGLAITQLGNNFKFAKFRILVRFCAYCPRKEAGIFPAVRWEWWRTVWKSTAEGHAAACRTDYPGGCEYGRFLPSYADELWEWEKQSKNGGLGETGITLPNYVEQRKMRYRALFSRVTTSQNTVT